MRLDLLATAFDDEVSTPLVRTDFTDDAAWAEVVRAVRAPVDFGGGDDLGGGDDDNYEVVVEPVEDRSFDGATAASVAAAARPELGAVGYLLLADAESMRTAGTDQATVAYVDLSITEEDEEEFGEVYGRSFRCAVPELASIVANLEIANMDFHEFADYADEHGGRFTGFEE